MRHEYILNDYTELKSVWEQVAVMRNKGGMYRSLESRDFHMKLQATLFIFQTVIFHRTILKWWCHDGHLFTSDSFISFLDVYFTNTSSVPIWLISTGTLVQPCSSSLPPTKAHWNVWEAQPQIYNIFMQFMQARQLHPWWGQTWRFWGLSGERFKTVK